MSKLSVKNFDGYVFCKSALGCYRTVCNDFSYDFDYGAYILQGEIDMGGWAISYSLCPAKRKGSDIILFDEKIWSFHDENVSIHSIQAKACYLDMVKENYWDLLQKRTIKQIIEHNLKKHDIGLNVNDIREMFCIDSERFERRLTQVGNSIYRCQAAIGFSCGKQIYCFPWISPYQMKTLRFSIEKIFEILSDQKAIILLPTSYEFPESSKYTIIKFGTTN